MPRIIEARNVGLYEMQKPFRLIVAGGSGTGKTYFVQQLVNKNHFTSDFDSIIYYSPAYADDTPEFIPHVEYKKVDLLTKDEISEIKTNTLFIFDDLMHESAKSLRMEQMFAVIARKKNVSLILMAQNLYQTGFRNLRLNCTGIVMFKFHAGIDINRRIIKDLGLKGLITSTELDTMYKNRHSYIYIDIHPNRLFDFGTIRANIFEKYLTIFYQMEYIAIPKTDFVKYFKIIKSKNGKIQAVKNAVEVKANYKRKRPKKPRISIESSSEDQSDDITRKQNPNDNSDSGSTGESD